MILLHKMISSSKCNQMGIICWSRDGHTSCTPDVRVAHLIGEDLQLISHKPVVIPEHMVV